ncbi:MAG: UbiD family decarboxylase [Steroidobacteraceae bacterium]|nr:UbiD family decarboxylase [Steroidobacteraceae bacterium]
MAYRDMRAFLAMLEKEGQLKHVDVPIDGRRGTNELQSLMNYVCSKDGPALILNNVSGYNTEGVPIIFNPFGTRERTAMTIGFRNWREAKLHHAAVLGDPARWIPPKLVDRAQAPCKEVVIKGAENISLDKQLPHVWFGKEGPAYITNAITFSKDPENGGRNAGWYRFTQFLDATHPLGGSYAPERAKRDLAAFYWWNPPFSDIGRHTFKASLMNKHLEVAIAGVCEPAVHLAAATGCAYGADEAALAGGLRGEALEMVQCETVDLQVPATAEWVLEGEVIFEETEAIGWHSNPVGYYDRVQVFPMVRVKCITHRRNPMWHATMEMVPPFDHNYIGLLPVEAEVLADLRRKIPEVHDVAVTPNMCYVVQLSVDGAQKPHNEFGKYVIHAVWGSAGRWGRTAKLVVVVGPDVDPYDMDSVEWAIMTRWQPVKDSLVNHSGPPMVLDPSCEKSAQFGAFRSEQMGIDATIKIPERFTEYPEVSKADPAAVAAIAKKLAGIV